MTITGDITLSGITIPRPSDVYLCGSLYAIIVLDPNNIIPEMNEANNIASDAVKVVCYTDGKLCAILHWRLFVTVWKLRNRDFRAFLSI